MISDHDQLLYTGGKRCDYVCFQDFSSFFKDNNLWVKVFQHMVIRGSPCGGSSQRYLLLVLQNYPHLSGTRCMPCKLHCKQLLAD